MMDPVGILGFLHSLSKEWRDPTVIVISPLSDIENEEAYQAVIEAGHKTRWVAERNLRRLSREGWSPITEKDKIGRPSVFMDAEKELLLMYQTIDT